MAEGKRVITPPTSGCPREVSLLRLAGALQEVGSGLTLLGMAHPCRTCGACCAFFRVEFYWREAGNAPHVVPLELTEEAGPHKMRMKGTNQKKALRCIALEGQIGREVSCKIYHQRATPCHEFSASYEHGSHNPRCDQARVGHGLEPLRPEDWGEQFPADQTSP